MNCRKNTLSRKIPWNSPLFTRSENPSQAALSGEQPFAGMEGRRTDAPIHSDKDLPKFLP